MFYLEVFRALEEHKVRYLLVGGLAMNLHGVPRMTMDIDLVIALDRKNLEGFIDAAASLQLQPVLPIALSDFLDSGKRDHWAKDRNMVTFALRPPQADGPTVDILIEPPIDIGTALDRAVYRDLGPTRAVLASIEEMIYKATREALILSARDMAKKERRQYEKK